MQIGGALARQAAEAGVALRAVAADCAYGDHDSFRRDLSAAGLPFVMALKRGHGTWQYKDAFRPVDPGPGSVSFPPRTAPAHARAGRGRARPHPGPCR
ncbi:hypothetical protein [Streptomyces sp. WAC 06725]|uniref:hypothetical protein n=1 Tax=Streptomyces sp. WAC 06725 TaxID=2203209 RepID=UPI0037DA01EF